jgi:hypothetical protein
MHSVAPRNTLLITTIRLTKKPNWACTVCGMWSSRKYSVRRHIQNKHNGYGMIVSFVDYLVGRVTGAYYPSTPHIFPGKKYEDKSKPSNIVDIFSEEYWREVARLAARKQHQSG